MKIEDDGSLTGHINDVPIWFALRALAFGVDKLEVKDPKQREALVEQIKRFSVHIFEKYGSI